MRVPEDRPASFWVTVNMRAIRKQRNMTQEELGAKLGWSKVVVSAAENQGRRARKFGIDEVVQIASILGVTVDEMIKPVPPCETCDDEPPVGFTCNTCGRSGEGRE